MQISSVYMSSPIAASPRADDCRSACLTINSERETPLAIFAGKNDSLPANRTLDLAQVSLNEGVDLLCQVRLPPLRGPMTADQPV